MSSGGGGSGGKPPTVSLTRWDSALHPDKGQEFLDEIGDVFFANTNVKHSCLAKYYLFVLSVLGKRGGGERGSECVFFRGAGEGDDQGGRTTNTALQ